MNSITYSIIILIVPFLATTLGSSMVFLFRKDQMNPIVEKICDGFASGVMLSASIFGLLIPALEDYEITYMPPILMALIAFILGTLMMFLIDHLIPHIHVEGNYEEGVENRHISRTGKMFLAVMIHNIPEGLSVGVALGTAIAMATEGSLSTIFSSALSLSIGIAIQNIPEGAVVSLPIRAETGSKKRGFLFGTIFGAVEPIFGVLGMLLSFYIEAIIPWALAFAAGSMIYVTVEDLIPNAMENSKHHYGIISFIAGFLIMMLLDYLL